MGSLIQSVTRSLIRSLIRISGGCEEGEGKDDGCSEVTLVLLVECGGPTCRGRERVLPVFRRLFKEILIGVRQTMADVKQRTSLEKVLGEDGAKIGQLWRKFGPAGEGKGRERKAGRALM